MVVFFLSTCWFSLEIPADWGSEDKRCRVVLKLTPRRILFLKRGSLFTERHHRRGAKTTLKKHYVVRKDGFLLVEKYLKEQTHTQVGVPLFLSPSSKFSVFPAFPQSIFSHFWTPVSHPLDLSTIPPSATTYLFGVYTIYYLSLYCISFLLFPNPQSWDIDRSFAISAGLGLDSVSIVGNICASSTKTPRHREFHPQGSNCFVIVCSWSQLISDHSVL